MSRPSSSASSSSSQRTDAAAVEDAPSASSKQLRLSLSATAATAESASFSPSNRQRSLMMSPSSSMRKRNADAVVPTKYTISKILGVIMDRLGHPLVVVQQSSSSEQPSAVAAAEEVDVKQLCSLIASMQQFSHNPKTSTMNMYGWQIYVSNMSVQSHVALDDDDDESSNESGGGSAADCGIIFALLVRQDTVNSTLSEQSSSKIADCIDLSVISYHMLRLFRDYYTQRSMTDPGVQSLFEVLSHLRRTSRQLMRSYTYRHIQSDDGKQLQEDQFEVQKEFQSFSTNVLRRTLRYLLSSADSHAATQKRPQQQQHPYLQIVDVSMYYLDGSQMFQKVFQQNTRNRDGSSLDAAAAPFMQQILFDSDVVESQLRRQVSILTSKTSQDVLLDYRLQGNIRVLVKKYPQFGLVLACACQTEDSAVPQSPAGKGSGSITFNQIHLEYDYQLATFWRQEVEQRTMQMLSLHKQLNTFMENMNASDDIDELSVIEQQPNRTGVPPPVPVRKVDKKAHNTIESPPPPLPPKQQLQMLDFDEEAEENDESQQQQVQAPAKVVAVSVVEQTVAATGQASPTTAISSNNSSRRSSSKVLDFSNDNDDDSNVAVVPKIDLSNVRRLIMLEEEQEAQEVEKEQEEGQHHQQQRQQVFEPTPPLLPRPPAIMGQSRSGGAPSRAPFRRAMLNKAASVEETTSLDDGQGHHFVPVPPPPRPPLPPTPPKQEGQQQEGEDTSMSSAVPLPPQEPPVLDENAATRGSSFARGRRRPHLPPVRPPPRPSHHQEGSTVESEGDQRVQEAGTAETEAGSSLEEVSQAWSSRLPFWQMDYQSRTRKSRTL